MILETITEHIENGHKIALAVVTKVWGSSPAPEGAMMTVTPDGLITGTVGGGSLEASVIEKAKTCLKEGKNGSFTFEFTNKEAEESLNMICGGKAEVFIRIFIPKPKLLIAGGGHVAYELYKLGKFLDFHTVIFEDRPEFGNKDRFPEADEIKVGDIRANLENYPIDENCYIVIVTRGHASDEEALKAVINTKAGYIGMIGSRKKVALTKEKIISSEKVSEDVWQKVYAPVGLNLGGDTPAEIALSIMAEILLIKNKGKLEHLKSIIIRR
ncbi:XdhC/CoxI family protein [Thermosyntropha sp.]|uniref:XdhC family protein n=1 Tax=Thermosyntropha sp. TaxID=2740820 RepID=UPI0025D95DB4|nr:XdhC/CoxI family protein [Thermosyntropha sp.]